MSARSTMVHLWRRGAPRALADSKGNSIPEYALLLGILVGGAVLACLIAGSSMDRAFTLASHFTESSAAAVSTRLAADEIGTGISRHRDDIAGEAVQLQSRIAATLAATLGILVFGVTVACGASIVRLTRKNRLRDTEADHGGVTVVPASVPSMRDRLMEKRQQIRRILTHDLESVAGFDTQVQHLMSRSLAVVPADMRVAEVVAIMDKKRIRHLLVCQDDGTLLGIISDRDLKQRSGETVRDIMTNKPVAVSPEMPMGPAITLMLQRNISCLPVVQDGTLLGVLTTTDILLSCQCMMQVLERVAAGLCQPNAASELIPEPTAWCDDDPL